jgi:hypothetical protein
VQQDAAKTLEGSAAANTKANANMSASAGGQSATVNSDTSTKGMTNMATNATPSMTHKVGKLSGAAEAKENALEAQTTKDLNNQQATITANGSANGSASATAQ